MNTSDFNSAKKNIRRAKSGMSSRQKTLSAYNSDETARSDNGTKEISNNNKSLVTNADGTNSVLPLLTTQTQCVLENNLKYSLETELNEDLKNEQRNEQSLALSLPGLATPSSLFVKPLSLKHPGVKILKDFLAAAPSLPGIYIFFDKNYKPIYVGKAKNIRNRVANYTLIEPSDHKKTGILEKINSVECKVCANELEALLLEAHQIKLLQPRYNVLLKDGKTFPEICITKSKDFPAIVYHKGKRLDNGDEYFGPFATVSDVKNVLSFVRKAFMTRNCSDWDFNTRKRPCMEYQIKRCTAPCVKLISKEDYNFNIKRAKEVLVGKHQEAKTQLIEKMNYWSEKMEYQKAGEIRDIIKSLAIINIQEKTGVHLIGDWDAFGLAYQNGIFIIEAVLIRNGNYHGSKSFPFEDKDAEDCSSLVSDFILQFYSYYPPNNILLGKKIEDLDLITRALQKKFDKKIRIEIVTKRSEKLKVIEFANNNAAQSLYSYAKKLNRNRSNLQLLREKLAIGHPIRYIEAFDNSHLFGEDNVGALIAAGEEGFVKKLYRRYNFKKDHFVNDYGMMREMIGRRLTSLKKEADELIESNNITFLMHENKKAFSEKSSSFYSDLINHLEENKIEHYLPGMWIIDGGLGQLNIITEVMREQSFFLPFIGISKGKFRNTDKENILLANGDLAPIEAGNPIYYYLQVVRDEVHRFAIAGYRNKHSKKMVSSSLDDVPGIGKTRKKQLLSHFGSLYNIKNASVDLLASTPGINRLTAQKIFDYLKK